MLPLVFLLIALSCYASHPSRDADALEPALADTDEATDSEVIDELEQARRRHAEKQLQELQKNLVVYYINTDQEAERREHMETQAKKAKMQLRRFKAIDRHRISMGEFDNKFVLRQGLATELLAPEREKDHVRNATVACYVSHAQLLEELQRILGPSQVAVVLEDDVEVPHNWLELVKKTLDCAPEDWSLLKVSGWGYNRNSDLWKPMEEGMAPLSSKKAALAKLSEHAKTLSSLASHENPDASNGMPALRGESVGSAQNFMGWLQSHGGWMSRILYGEAEPKPRRMMRAYQPEDVTSVMEQRSITLDEEELSCPDVYLMRQPFKEQFWWHFWGPAFHYAGTGAYIVKASSINRILQHLQSQPIDDIDGMLLSKGELRAYELWPHIFPLTTDHMRSTLLSTASEATKEDAISEEPAERPGQENTMLSGLSSWLPSWDASASGEYTSRPEGGEQNPAALGANSQGTEIPCKTGLPCNGTDAQLPEKKMPTA
eukprot:TRINITY_DN5022_c0_g1_i1.p1 TRINITY_DN5022_c0_g1~~TRINITY_DN5022_c0_g1_i1.p1  ORF type:complete len:490 (+),score=110.57 TRINITY_DN5022_c0_g1_i1:69-1538(+)